MTARSNRAARRRSTPPESPVPEGTEPTSTTAVAERLPTESLKNLDDLLDGGLCPFRQLIRELHQEGDEIRDTHEYLRLR